MAYIKKSLLGIPRKQRLVPYPAKLCFNVSSDLPGRINRVADAQGLTPSQVIRFALENYVRFAEIDLNVEPFGAPFDCEVERRPISIKDHLPKKVSIKDHLP